MATSAIIQMARGMQQRSVSTDLRTSQVKVEANLSAMETNRDIQEFKQDVALAKAEEAKKQAEEFDSFWGGVRAFVGDDDELHESKHDAQVASAEVEKAKNEGSLLKADQKDAVSSFSDAVDQAGKVNQQLEKAMSMLKELRRESQGGS